MRIPLVIGATMVCGASAHAAFVIDDRAYFAGTDHAFLDFESNGDGDPLNLFFKELRFMPSDEYANQGIQFHGPMAWADPGPTPGVGASLSDAIDAVGSWPTVITSTQSGAAFELEFLVPVRSFGFGVAQQAFVHFGEPSADYTTTITAFNAVGEVIGVTQLWDETIDGGTGNVYAGGVYGEQWRVWNYGFLGLATDEPIARLRFDNAWQSVFDDLHFSAIPAPGAGVTLGVVGLMGVGRRRR
jgi:hypothetical protein